MTYDRRELLKSGAVLSIATALPNMGLPGTRLQSTALAQSGFYPRPGSWRTFDIVTRLEVAKPEGTVQAWIPLPSVNETLWSQPGGNTWTTNAKIAEVERDPKYGAEMLHVEWAEAEKTPVVEVTSRISSRDRAVDLTQPGGASPLTATERQFYLEPTDLIPTHGIVKEAADRIVANASTEIEKARAIYSWVVENTHRDAKVRGCGLGDIAAMLETGNLGGKCADLNALFVGLARASNLPARDLYGLRVAPSRFGYKSLGVSSNTVTKAQHCRAEVYLTDIGWVPVDPADVRKVVLEEPPGNLALDNAKVTAARRALLGAWEGNWVAFNQAHDIALPGAEGHKLGFLMYPQAETAAARLDCLDPDTFKYTIKSSEISA
jgi:transglutaminase-like putative cysteine protease